LNEVVEATTKAVQDLRNERARREAKTGTDAKASEAVAAAESGLHAMHEVLRRLRDASGVELTAANLRSRSLGRSVSPVPSSPDGARVAVLEAELARQSKQIRVLQDELEEAHSMISAQATSLKILESGRADQAAAHRREMEELEGAHMKIIADLRTAQTHVVDNVRPPRKRETTRGGGPISRGEEEEVGRILLEEERLIDEEKARLRSDSLAKRAEETRKKQEAEAEQRRRVEEEMLVRAEEQSIAAAEERAALAALNMAKIADVELNENRAAEERAQERARRAEARAEEERRKIAEMERQREEDRVRREEQKARREEARAMERKAGERAREEAEAQAEEQRTFLERAEEELERVVEEVEEIEEIEVIGNASTGEEEIIEEEEAQSAAPTLYLISHSEMFLADSDGSPVTRDAKGEQTEWRLSDAGNGSFFISNHLGHYLGDEPGELYGSSVLCSEHRGKAQRWELSCAGGDYVFLTSYLGKQLSDHEGAVSTENEKGRHEKWLIETGAGEIISLEGQDDEPSPEQPQRAQSAPPARPAPNLEEPAQIVLRAQMAKMGSYGFGTTWNQRYIVLDTHHLSLFDDRKARVAKTIVPLSEIQQVKSSNKRPFAIKLKTSIAESRLLTGKDELAIVLDAGDAGTQMEWINTIAQMMTSRNNMTNSP